ncbi:MAG: alpha/beta fold hydrolase [Arenimonas sp.]
MALAATDGHPLAAHRYDPAGTVRGSVVIAPAMAISQSFYGAFARWLATQGYVAWTFDYRGTGESLRGAMRGAPGTLDDWCDKDYDAAVQAANALHPQRPLFALGHSFGGQCAPLLPSRRLLTGLVNIAVGSGAMRHNTPRIRHQAPWLWYLLVPVLCPVFGYFPGARLGVIGDLPSGAVRQWRKWCLDPDYLLGAEPRARAAYAGARYQVLGLSFADDELLLEAGSEMLHAAYGRPVDYRVLSPEDIGLARIGHSGFFRPQSEPSLWPLVTNWMAAVAARTDATPA